MVLGLALGVVACSSRPPPPGPGFGASQTAPQSHQVVSGDTVYGISRRYGVPMREIIAANGLTPPFVLRIGQVLRLPGQAVHVVQRGETVYSIARAHNMNMNELARANGLGSDYMIQVGQRLSLPGASGATAPAPSAPAVSSGPVTVASGSAPVAPPPVDTGTGTQVGDRIGVAPAPTNGGPPPPGEKPTVTQPATPVSVATTSKGPVPAAPARTGRFSWPLEGKMLSGYGPTDKGQHNDGINIAAPSGTVVRASESGVVVYAGNEIRGFGNLILLKHEGGLMTAYAHNEVLLVGRGAVIDRGQGIARVGDSGGVSQPQLHFEIRANGKPVDPLPYLEGQRVAMR
jgi:murein DD-endopeptidase MepM/ murein hydrolase activator NlpD